MAGSRQRRRRRRRRGARSSQQSAGSSSLGDATLSTREVTIVEKSGCTSSGPYVCADLLDNLLHEIIVLMNSFQDFLAFSGTCHSWRAAVSSFPSVYAFSFPPLHLEPDGPYVPPHSRGFKSLCLSNCKWKLNDLTKKNLSLQCSVPQNIPNEMDYLGCSHGYLIFTYEEHCLLVDAYTGAKVMPPKLPCNNNLGYSSGIGVLTAPFSSPNSRLLLFSRVSMLEQTPGQSILLILSMNASTRLCPSKFSMKEVAVTWRSLWTFPLTTWLVVCGDMLLMVDFTIASLPSVGSSLSFGRSNGAIRFFEVFRLDFSVKPAKWVHMEKLENHALFLSLDRRNPAFSCVNPERWGGKSNCVYVARLFDDANQEDTWTALEVGQSVPHHRIVETMMYGMTFPPDYSQIGSLWLFPSLVYGATQ
ncbi:unnamed protein product [Miscanthus lutarioriparius]|uniref:KIB1-4 beta-propeller domain-containing protein n=1 Tax=Miscanthus lutarioriparius TaxID=422564 RepID=A0A811QI45_9POAL|nr:unnamed protein product [Miscanthus lutarioriparius]